MQREHTAAPDVCQEKPLAFMMRVLYHTVILFAGLLADSMSRRNLCIHLIRINSAPKLFLTRQFHC